MTATKKTDYLYVGIDLGTSQSSVSASNGERQVVQSLVGWPVDNVARKILKKDVLIGAEALESRTMLDFHRPLERGLVKEGSEKEMAAVRELLKHLLSLAKADGGNEKVRAVVGVPSAAMRVNKQQLRNTLAGIVDGVMIVSEPFAVAYGADALLHTLIVDLGAGTTDLCVMEGHYPTEDEQRTLSAAGDSIDEQLSKLVSEKHPEASFNIHMVRRWKEEHSFVGKTEQPVKVTVPVKGKPTQIDITEAMRTACESVIEPVSEAMRDLLARVDPEFQEPVRNHVILSGCTSLIPGLDQALAKELDQVGGGKVTRVKDPVFAGSDGGLSLAEDAVESDWEKLSS
jgi:rod shape-determining protein MreB